jgi:hypothetical protein
LLRLSKYSKTPLKKRENRKRGNGKREVRCLSGVEGGGRFHMVKEINQD